MPMPPPKLAKLQLVSEIESRKSGSSPSSAEDSDNELTGTETETTMPGHHVGGHFNGGG